MDVEGIIDFIKSQYPGIERIPLHEPRFTGREKEFVIEAIESTFVSSVGKFVIEVEEKLASITGSKYGIAVVNGTSALHLALECLGVSSNDEVITQSLTFIATSNAIAYTGATPIYLDVDLETMGLSPKSLKIFLRENCTIKNGACINKNTNRQIKVCLPMHTFGFPCNIFELSEICKEWNIHLVEDAAEALGSKYMNRPIGSFGTFGIFSFNGNKIITSGGGGMLVTNDDYLAKKAKHLSTQAKIDHPWEYAHDYVGYNYRMPNLNAALLSAQIDNLDFFVSVKRQLAKKYQEFFAGSEVRFFVEPSNSYSNYWLNSILCKDRMQRDQFLNYSNEKGVMCRPIWRLMSNLPMFKRFKTEELINSQWLEDRIVNIPSSVQV